jgi:hypothetical protein
MKKINQFKRGICEWLNQHSMRWSGKKLKVFVFTFFLIGAGASFYVAATAIFKGANCTCFTRSTKSMLTIPNSYPDYHLERSRMMLNKIEKDKRYLDSLATHDTARYQLIIKSNPKVVENMRSLESLFRQLIKK